MALGRCRIGSEGGYIERIDIRQMFFFAEFTVCMKQHLQRAPGTLEYLQEFPSSSWKRGRLKVNILRTEVPKMFFQEKGCHFDNGFNQLALAEIFRLYKAVGIIKGVFHLEAKGEVLWTFLDATRGIMVVSNRNLC